MVRIPLIEPKPRKGELEKIFEVPRGYVPTGAEKTNGKLKIKFTKFKYGIRQRPFIEEEIFEIFDIPEGFEYSRAFTIERGLLPSKFRVFFKKIGEVI